MGPIRKPHVAGWLVQVTRKQQARGPAGSNEALLISGRAEARGPLALVGRESGFESGQDSGIAIEGKAELDVTPKQALRTMRALLLAHKSSRENATTASFTYKESVS